MEKGLRVGDFGSLTEKTLYYLGQAYVKAGDPEKGEQLFQDLKARYPQSDFLKKRL